MTKPRLHIWKTLGEAIYAPFCLEVASWKALARPVLALIVAAILLITANYFQLNSTVQLILYLPVWVMLAWFALDFQRHLLLGASGAQEESGKWLGYGYYFMALVVVSVFMVLFPGILLNMVLPALVWFAMALNSSNSWLASVTVVLWILVIGAASYPLVRIAMILPAISAGHSFSPKFIWRLSHKQGLKLLVLLILIPGIINGLLYLVVEAYSSQLWAIILISILDTYVVLIYLSILALSYQKLSVQKLPTVIRSATVPEQLFNFRVLWPLISILLLAVGVAAVLDAVYKVNPGENVIISRLGKSVRVESDPGFNIKIPFLESSQKTSKEESFKVEGSGQFLIITKDVLSLKYEAYWHIVNTNAFVRTTNGQHWNVDMRLEQLIQDELRNQLIRLKQEEVRNLKSGGKKKFSIKDELKDKSSLAGILHDINSRVKALGIEMSAWSLESDRQP